MSSLTKLGNNAFTRYRTHILRARKAVGIGDVMSPKAAGSAKRLLRTHPQPVVDQ